MKKILALILALCMAFALCACSSSETPAADSAEATEAPAEAPAESTAEPVTLRFAFSEAPESQTAEVMAGVKERIESRTEGRVIIEPHWSNELGSIADAIEQISLGGNIVSSTSASSWAPYCSGARSLANRARSVSNITPA